MAQVFWTNQRPKWSKPKPIPNYCRYLIKICSNPPPSPSHCILSGSSESLSVIIIPPQYTPEWKVALYCDSKVSYPRTHHNDPASKGCLETYTLANMKWSRNEWVECFEEKNTTWGGSRNFCLVYISAESQSTIRSGYFGIPSSHIDVKIYFCSQGLSCFS